MTVMLSRSEIKSEVEKAIRGVGFDWGRAKDAGVMAAWLATHDQVFLGSLLRGLDHVVNHDDDIVFAPVNAMMLTEYVLAADQDWSGHIMGIRFVIAAMGIVSEEQNAVLSLSEEHGLIAYAEHGEVWINPILEASDRDVTLSTSAQDYSKQSLQKLSCSEHTAHEVSLSCWQRLGIHAHQVYVKETEEKRRSGAGAGDIDNT